MFFQISTFIIFFSENAILRISFIQIEAFVFLFLNCKVILGGDFQYFLVFTYLVFKRDVFRYKTSGSTIYIYRERERELPKGALSQLCM
jgi:hypothetical protein